MQSAYTHTVPSPPQLYPTSAHQASGQGGPFYSGAVQIPQRTPRHPGAGNHQYHDNGAIPSQSQAYNGATASQQQWSGSSQPPQEHMRSWLSSAASSNPPPLGYGPTPSYDPHTYGPMPGVHHPAVDPSRYHDSLADTSTWGVRYNQDGVILGQTSKPPLPPRPISATQYAQNEHVPQFTLPVYTPQPPAQQPNTDQILTSYNFPTVSQSQGSHVQYPLPPPPPPKTPQYYQDLAANEQTSHSPQLMYHHQSGLQPHHPNLQNVPQYVEGPRYGDHRPDSYLHTSPFPPQSTPNSYHPSAPAYRYQDNVHSDLAQPPYSQPVATPSSPNLQRRNKWASIGEQTIRPIVSPPLPDHDVLLHRQDAPSTVANTMPPSPTSTLDYEQPPQALDAPNGRGWTQLPGVRMSFDNQICQTCGQQISDQGVCQFCHNEERGDATEPSMQGHVDPLLRLNRTSENQSMIGHQEAHERVTRQESPFTHDIHAVDTPSIPDVEGALETDNFAARASVSSAGVSAASALGRGGPSDWEHFGTYVEDEIDDTYLFSPTQSVVALPSNAAELPSKSTPPPNVPEQDQANQAFTQPEQVLSFPSSQIISPAEAPSSKVSQLTVQADVPPLPVTEPAAAVPRAGPMPPTRVTFAEDITRIGNIPSSQSDQQKIDEAIVAGSNKSEASTREMISIQGTPLKFNVISGKDIYPQQASSHVQNDVSPKQPESGHIGAQTADADPRFTASQAIVLDSKGEYEERLQHLSSMGPLTSKPTGHDEKNVQHQIHEPYADLDSWAKASLSRFVVMLRSEASAGTDEEKLHVFTSFMSKESLLREVLYGPMSDTLADGTEKLAQPVLERTRGTLMDAKPQSDVLLTLLQAGPTPSRPVDAPLPHRDTPALSPEVHLGATERSVSSAQTTAPSTREPLPHPVDPTQSDKDCISIVGPKAPQHEQEPSPSWRDVSIQRDRLSISDRDNNQSGRELTRSHTPVSLKKGSKATSQPTTAEKSTTTLAISIPAPPKDTEPEDDTEYSPGGRPIVSYSSRVPTRGQQDPDDDPRHTSPSRVIAKKANATQNQHNTVSPSPCADAPIVVDITGESQTSIRPTAGALQRYSSPMLPAFADESPAYARNRRTESFPSASEPPLSQSQYKAYSAPDQIGTTVRTIWPHPNERDLLDLASQHPKTPKGLPEAIDALRKILPAEGTPDRTARYDEKVAAAKHEIENVQDDFGFIKKTAVAWNAEAKTIREQNEKDRRHRQEQSEERIDGLFHDNEIGYSDIGALEAEYKGVEAGKRAQEENDEQESFVQNVFEVVTGKVQFEIDLLSHHYHSLLHILGNAATCRETFNTQEERPEISQLLEAVLLLHAKLETRHRKVIEAVLEKDRRFRKTQLAPLYAEGKVTEMKKSEKRFDLTERELVLEAARAKDDRANKLTHTVDEHTLRGIQDNQEYTSTISGGIGTISEAMSHDSDVHDPIDVRELLTLASFYVSCLLANSRRLMQQCNSTDVILNDADYDVSAAEAKVANADGETLKRLKDDKHQEDVKLKEDLEQRMSSVTTDSGVVTEQIEGLIVRVEDFEGKGRRDGKPLPQESSFGHESRMQRALEQAKERNTPRPKD